VLLASALLILISGGTEFHWQKRLVTAYSASNLLFLITLLLPLRLLAANALPLLGIPALSLKNISKKSYSLCAEFYNALIHLERKQAWRLVLAIIVVSAAIKIANAWFYYGFISGDDVEIHEMTLSRLFHRPWPIWGIRNAFYPMVFIFPIQALLKAFGCHDPQILVFAGRMVVMLFSSFSIYLVYRITAEIAGGIQLGLLAAFFFAFSKLHVTFSGSELPRSVATCFILLGFWFLVKSATNSVAVPLAGISLGIAAATRFSELIFILPAAVFLMGEKRMRQVAILVFFFALSFFAILGISDLLYWKKAFFSLINIVNFTLVKKLSSRGYQPFYQYLSDFPHWTNFFVLAMAAFATTMKKWRIWIWALLPLGLLSLLPHKEPRYLIPVIPFMAILTAVAVFHLLGVISGVKTSARVGKIQTKTTFFLFFFAVSMLFEMDGFRFRKSETAIDIARYLAARPARGVIALEEIWHFGGKIYLPDAADTRDVLSADLERTDYGADLLTNDGLEYVAMKNQTIVRNGYEELLKKSGFSEVAFGPGKGYHRFRLFKKALNNRRFDNDR
jgi:hypothetical protein